MPARWIDLDAKQVRCTLCGKVLGNKYNHTVNLNELTGMHLKVSHPVAWADIKRIKKMMNSRRLKAVKVNHLTQKEVIAHYGYKIDVRPVKYAKQNRRIVRKRFDKGQQVTANTVLKAELKREYEIDKEKRQDQRLAAQLQKKGKIVDPVKVLPPEGSRAWLQVKLDEVDILSERIVLAKHEIAQVMGRGAETRTKGLGRKLKL